MPTRNSAADSEIDTRPYLVADRRLEKKRAASVLEQEVTGAVDFKSEEAGGCGTGTAWTDGGRCCRACATSDATADRVACAGAVLSDALCSCAARRDGSRSRLRRTTDDRSRNGDCNSSSSGKTSGNGAARSRRLEDRARSARYPRLALAAMRRTPEDIHKWLDLSPVEGGRDGHGVGRSSDQAKA